MMMPDACLFNSAVTKVWIVVEFSTVYNLLALLRKGRQQTQGENIL